MSMAKLWGLTLLERMIRELAQLGFEEIVVVRLPQAASTTLIKHTLPNSVVVRFETVASDRSFDALVTYLNASRSLVLVLQGNALYDKRILDLLTNTRGACGLLMPNGTRGAAAGVLSAAAATLMDLRGQERLTANIHIGLEAGTLKRLDLAVLNPYLKNLRRTVCPFIILVETAADLEKADATLRQTVHKGTNDFVAMYIHPPLEFGITRLLAPTKVTPNQVTFLGMIFSSLAIYLFATGRLVEGILCAATKGVLDGVDGKLARLHIKYSKAGDLLDHVGDIIFDALWYLALGWHFAHGDVSSTAATFTIILFVAYWIQRIVPGVFEKRHGHEIYDYEEIDKFVRLIGSRMNNNVWVMMLGILLGFAQASFYGVSIWMAATALWYTSRLVYVSWRVSAQPSSMPPDQRL
jgi:phosphatidylglycerophosphate synthase